MPPLSTLNKTALTLAITQAVAMSSAQAATIFVNNFTDVGDQESCTLRQAIVSANTDAASGGCVIGNGDDVIRFQNTEAATISLTNNSNLPTISENLEIRGPVHLPIAINGGDTNVFFINNDAEVTLDHLTIEGSRFQGVRAYSGDVTISNSIIRNNDSVGVFGGENSLLTIERSTIAANRSTGVDSRGIVNISNSTISDNTAVQSGGGVSLGGPESSSITNSTITGNATMNSGIGGGGIEVNSGASLELSHSIVSGNSGPRNSEIFVASTSTIDTAFNVLGSSSTTNADAFSIGFVPSNSDIDATSTNGSGGIDLSDIINTQLADNGGSTPTHNLALNSVAIDAIDDATICGQEDQRGESRGDVSMGCDIGAVEYLPSNQDIVVTSSLSNGSDGCNLSNAIASVNTNRQTGNCIAGGVDDIISFADNIDIIALLNVPSLIRSDVTVQGNGVIIDGQGQRRLLEVSDGGSAVINNLTLRNGSSSSYGGAGLLLARGGNAILNNSSVIDNQSAGTGGGIRIFRNSRLQVINSTITDNTSVSFGGGIRVDDSILDISSSTISMNAVSTNSNIFGGGISAVNNSVVALSSSTVLANSANSGGGINVDNSSLSLTNSTVSENRAELYGGGINGSNSSVSLTNSTVSENFSVFGGGGISIRSSGSSLSLSNSIVSGNYATNDGNEIVLFSSYSISDSLLGSSISSGNSAFYGFTPSSTENIIATYDGNQPTALRSILGALQNNGGSTQTHALVANSPAINAANNGACPATDQREETRDNQCDIGAFEFIEEEPIEEESFFVVPLPNGKSVIFSL